MGQAVHNQNIIRLGKLDPQGQEYHIQKIEECFIHEMLHAIDCIYNSNKMEEDVINRLSQGLYQVLKDNKLLKE